jgi:hypothetical protein
MSVQAITAAFAVQGVSPSEKLVLLALANFADAEGRCWPSQARLALDTGLTDRQIRRVFVSLIDAGLMTKEHRRRRDGYRASDLITLTIFEDTVSAKGKPYRTFEDNLTGHLEPILPDTVSYPTTLEPSVEPSVEPLEAAQAQPQAKPDPKGTRLPDEWSPQLSEVAFAKQQGMTLEEISLEADKFRDFWCAKPGAGGRKSDWSATWRNWCRNRRSGAGVAGGARSGGNRQGPSDFASIIAERRGRAGV